MSANSLTGIGEVLNLKNIHPNRQKFYGSIALAARVTNRSRRSGHDVSDESFVNARGDGNEVHANFLEFTSTPHPIQVSASSVRAGMTCLFAHLEGDAF
jgi:hypothetical protein